MLKQKHSKVIFILFFLLLLVFEFFSMQSLVLKSSNLYALIVYVIVFGLSAALLVTNRMGLSNYFFKLFVFWLVFIILRFFTSTTGHELSVSFFTYTWFCNCYIVAYLAGKPVINREKILISFMLALWLIAAFFTYQNLLVMSSGYIDLNDITQNSNIIFWSLCTIPFIFLLEKPSLQLILLSAETVLVLVTIKRSALIAMGLILLLFAFSIFFTDKNKSQKKGKLSKFRVIVLAVSIILAFLPKFSNLFDSNIMRISEIREDGGTGRVDIWKDTFDALDNSSVITFVFGNGTASTYETIHHTSSHNDFLTLFIEFGLCGVVLYLLFVIKLLSRVFYTRKQNTHLFYCYTSLAIIVLVVGNVGDLFTCYTYLGFLLVILAVLEQRLEFKRKT